MSEEWGYAVLKKTLLEKKEYFEDKGFPSNLKSITFDGILPNDFPLSEIVWKRPREIAANPHFVKSSVSRSDLDQGLLGNCWFVAAAALLANGSKEMFEKCVPLDQDFQDGDYAGIFRFNFWDYGIWKEVIIDDLLPTDGTNLIFCHNKLQKDEFWGALFEKAYAKFKGNNYESIVGGKLGTALVDFTCGLSEIIYLSNPKVTVPPNLYQLLQKNRVMDTLIGACIYKDDKVFGRESRLPNGLFQGHAYGITDITEVVQNSTVTQLVRLRNPHGENEWNGPWSDSSPEMRSLSTDVLNQIKQVKADDGEFWMSFKDFLENFDEICLCHLIPSSLSLDPRSIYKNWRVTEFHDAWINGLTAGGCGNPPNQNLFWKNPQFQIHLIDPDTTDGNNLCTLIVSLVEKEKQIDMNEVTIGFDIFQIRDKQNQPVDADTLPPSALKYVARSGTYQGYREVVRRFELKPAYYVIIPSTFFPNKEAKFLLRIYTETPITSEVLDENNAPELSNLEPDPIFDLFKKHAGDDGRMDHKELQTFLEEATGNDMENAIQFQEETCRSLLVLMDKDRSGFLNAIEAKHAYREIMAYVVVFRQFDKDKSNTVDMLELGTMFKKLGFPVSRNVLLSIVRRYGSRSGLITLEDFIVAVCKLTTMYFVFVNRQKKVAGPDDIAVFTRNEIDGSLAMPIDRMVMPTDRRAKPTDHRSTPVDHRAMPSDRRAMPNDRGAMPNDRRAMPNDHRATSTDHRATPTDHRATPADHRAMPTNSKTMSTDRRAMPTDRRAMHTDFRATHTDRSATHTAHR